MSKQGARVTNQHQMENISDPDMMTVFMAAKIILFYVNVIIGDNQN